MSAPPSGREHPSEPDLPDSLRHLFDGAADPTPLGGDDSTAPAYAQDAPGTGPVAEIDLTDETAREPAEDERSDAP